MIFISISAVPFDPDHLEKMIKREYLIETMRTVLDSQEYRVIIDYFFSCEVEESIGKDSVFQKLGKPSGVGRSRISQIKSDAIKKLNWRLFEDARQCVKNSETLDFLSNEM